MNHLNNVVHERVDQTKSKDDSVGWESIDFCVLIDVSDVKNGHQKIDQMHNQTN